MERQEFNKKCKEAIDKAVSFSEKARREGLLSLEDEVSDLLNNSCSDYICGILTPIEGTDKLERNIFYTGILLVIYGVEPEIVKKILTNLVRHEKDDDKRLIKEIQKEAVLLIQAGYNYRYLFQILTSYLDDALAIEIQKIYQGEKENYTEPDLENIDKPEVLLD